MKPQSEHLAPVSGDCALKLDFIGKSERFEEDWIAFFQAQRCASEPRPPAQLVSAAQAKRCGEFGVADVVKYIFSIQSGIHRGIIWDNFKGQLLHQFSATFRERRVLGTFI